MSRSDPVGASDQGLAANRGQFALLLGAIVLAVMVTGAERSVLPVLGREEFGIRTTTATLSFIVAFGLAKATADFLAGTLAERIGRKRVLLLGWIAAVPVAPLIIFAPSWAWVVGANVLLGTASSFIWSSSVVMRLDLAGPRRRGLAMGLSGLGPIFLGITALVAGWLAQRYGPRPIPFLIAAVAAVLGLLLALPVRDTGDKAQAEEDGIRDGRGQGGHGRGGGAPQAGGHGASGAGGHGVPDGAPDGIVHKLVWASWRKKELLASNQAGLALNVTDGVVWGIFPLFLAQQGMGLREIGWIAGVYPIVVGLVEGAAGPLSDRWGRRPLIAGGMLTMGAGLAAFASVEGLGAWLACAALMGAGYAAAFPTLSAQVGDVVAPRSRPAAIGVYRMWRDVGHAVGGLTAGILADVVGFRWAMVVVAAVVGASGLAAGWKLPSRHPG